MKKQTCLYLTLAVSMAITVTQASVLWYGDPNNSVSQDFGFFDTTPGPAGNCLANPPPATATTVQDPTYNRLVWTIHKPVGIERAEFARTDGTKQNYVPKSGDDIYIGYHWKINTSPALNAGIIVFQWKSTGNNLQDYPFKLMYDGQQLSMTCTGPLYNGGNGTGSVQTYTTTVWNQSLALNTWAALIFHVKVSSDPNVGFLEIYFNGVKQTLSNSNPAKSGVKLGNNNTTAYCKTLDISGNICKWGAYDGPVCNYITQTYYDEMHIATTLSEAQPGNY